MVITLRSCGLVVCLMLARQPGFSIALPDFVANYPSSDDLGLVPQGFDSVYTESFPMGDPLARVADSPETAAYRCDAPIELCLPFSDNHPDGASGDVGLFRPPSALLPMAAVMGPLSFGPEPDESPDSVEPRDPNAPGCMQLADVVITLPSAAPTDRAGLYRANRDMVDPIARMTFCTPRLDLEIWNDLLGDGAAGSN